MHAPLALGACQAGLPSILPGDCVTVGRVVDETDVDSDQRCSVRSNNLSADDTSVAAQTERERGREKKKTATQSDEVDPFCARTHTMKREKPATGT